MDKMVKHVFTFLMWVTIAWLLYLVFFGTYSLQGRDMTSDGAAYTGNIDQTVAWEGVLWHAAKAIENPISKYYYEFCYLPNIHASDYVDEALGGMPAYGDLFSTETDLSLVNSDMYTLSPNYSSGWR